MVLNFKTGINLAVALIATCSLHGCRTLCDLQNCSQYNTDYLSYQCKQVTDYYGYDYAFCIPDSDQSAFDACSDAGDYYNPLSDSCWTRYPDDGQTCSASADCQENGTDQCFNGHCYFQPYIRSLSIAVDTAETSSQLRSANTEQPSDNAQLIAAWYAAGAQNLSATHNDADISMTTQQTHNDVDISISANLDVLVDPEPIDTETSDYKTLAKLISSAKAAQPSEDKDEVKDGDQSEYEETFNAEAAKKAAAEAAQQAAKDKAAGDDFEVGTDEMRDACTDAGGSYNDLGCWTLYSQRQTCDSDSDCNDNNDDSCFDGWCWSKLNA